MAVTDRFWRCRFRIMTSPPSWATADAPYALTRVDHRRSDDARLYSPARPTRPPGAKRRVFQSAPSSIVHPASTRLTGNTALATILQTVGA